MSKRKNIPYFLNVLNNERNLGWIKISTLPSIYTFYLNQYFILLSFFKKGDGSFLSLRVVDENENYHVIIDEEFIDTSSNFKILLETFNREYPNAEWLYPELESKK